MTENRIHQIPMIANLIFPVCCDIQTHPYIILVKYPSFGAWGPVSWLVKSKPLMVKLPHLPVVPHKAVAEVSKIGNL